MAYENDKQVIFAFMRRVDYNKTIEEIISDLGYDFGDYKFGKGDTPELRRKIEKSIFFMRTQLNGIFDENDNTKP